MAATYVYSLGSKQAHLGGDRRTACGVLLPEPVTVSDSMPSRHTLCPRCLSDAATAGVISPQQMLAMIRHVPVSVPHPYTDEDAAVLASLYKQGLNDKQVAARLGVSLRTVIRRVSFAMSRVGAGNRWQWAYLVGLTEGRAGL